MISDNREVLIKVVGEGGTATSREAESLGLIATELVMNMVAKAALTLSPAATGPTQSMGTPPK